MSVPIFRKGSWIQYPLPAQVDSLWSDYHFFQAASFYASALSQGYSPSESASLAECYVHKNVYSGIRYSSAIEKKIAKIMGHAGTT